MSKGQSTQHGSSGNGHTQAYGAGASLVVGLGGVGTDLYGAASNPLWNGWCGPRGK